MLARELKDLVNHRSCLPITLLTAVNSGAEGNLSDFGISVAHDSTYLRAGMRADIVDACRMPPIAPGLLDAADYFKAIVPGLIYFVFYHGIYRDQNEPLASREWQNSNPKQGELARGTAFETGAYSGYDMVGFPPDQDLTQLFAVICD